MLDPEVILGIIDRNAVFGDLLTSENKTFLINNSLVRPVETGEVLCQQNTLDNTLFLIIDGEVEISIASDDKITTLGRLGAGELVGEISSLLLIPRIATVTVTEPSVVLEIPCEVFSEILAGSVDMQLLVNKRCHNRIVETSLRCVPAFNDIDPQSFSELCYISSLVKANKNDVIVHEGKLERQLYVICSGTARVFITVGGTEITTKARRLLW